MKFQVREVFERWNVIVVILCASTSTFAAAAQHPMDPLSAEEIDAAVQIVKDSDKVGGRAAFPLVRLVEMPKSEVVKWSSGAPISRKAEVQVVTASGFFRAQVDLDAGALIGIQEITDGRPLLRAGEVFAAMKLINGNADWKAALAKRGIEKTSEVIALPFFRGYWGNADDHDRHLYRMYAFHTSEQDNYWGRPIGGLSAVVDLWNKKVLRVADTGPIPLPNGVSDFNDSSNASARKRTNPVSYQQAGGPSYKIDGNVIRWGQWELHVRMELQEGLVLSNITFDGRSVLYQGSVSELFVPYMDPTEHWYFRNFMDAGEVGLGATAVPLMRGVDCPESATMLSPVMADAAGKGRVNQDLIGIYERYCGDPSWRHLDPVSRKAYGNRAQALVVRSISTVGNYDYAFDWMFDPSGAIKIRVGATGICSSKPVSSKTAADDTTGADGAYGRFVDNHTVAVNHDHYIAYRLDFDVDGTRNRFSKDTLTPVEFQANTPRTSGWIVKSQTADTENDAKLKLNTSSPSMWRVLSSERMNKNGYPTSYHIAPHVTTFTSLLDQDDWPQRRGAFSKYNLYVTPYNANERYAGGYAPNQNHGVDGLAYWSAADRPIRDTDIVAWYTVGFHHVVRAEDWPVMPTAWHEVSLRPFDFADSNPLMDVIEND